ncbi:MAG: acyl-CoA thioesterase [Leptospiraceae bacterium]|nr:acyl-CoA thioesterase [Leptospiraceae bacterium]
MITSYFTNQIARHSEQDFTQSINKTTCFRFLEEARVQMMRDRNFDINEVHLSHVLMVLYKCNIRFFKPIKFFDEIKIESSTIQVKKVRGILKQIGRRMSDNVECFEADAYWAYVPKNNLGKEKTVEFATRFAGDADGFLEPIPLEIYPLENTVFPFECSFETRPYEMDGFNHLNNCIYYSYFETAAYQYLKVFIPWDEIFSKRIIVDVNLAQIDFIQPVFSFEKFSIGVIPLEINNPDLKLGLMLKSDSGELKSKCILHIKLKNNSTETKSLLIEAFEKMGHIKLG